MKLKAWFGSISIFVAMLSLVSPSSSFAQNRYQERNQQAFTQAMGVMFDFFIQYGAGEVMSYDNGTRVNLVAMKAQAMGIRYMHTQSLFLTKGSKPIHCVNDLGAQWLTAADSPDGRPTIAYTKYDDMSQFSGEQWRLLFHEAISALGWVDDEYQISSPVLHLAVKARELKVRIASLKADPVYAAMFIPLSKIKTRKHAPRYKLNERDLCYKWNGNVGALQNERYAGGNSTGIGGGGSPLGMQFKSDLLLKAGAWWKQFAKDRSNEELATFIKHVTEIGAEPFGSRTNLIATIPIQMEFMKSQRTGKLTAFFMIDRLHRNLKEKPDSFCSYRSPFSNERLSVAQGDWCGALHLVYEHILHQVMAAKTPAEATRWTVYGTFIAEHRGIKGIDYGLNAKPGPFYPDPRSRAD